MLKAYQNLSPKTRLGLGLGVIAWATAGLYLSDKAEETFGYTPTDKDKEELRRMTPRIIAVDRRASSSEGDGGDGGGGSGRG